MCCDIYRVISTEELSHVEGFQFHSEYVQNGSLDYYRGRAICVVAIHSIWLEHPRSTRCVLIPLQLPWQLQRPFMHPVLQKQIECPKCNLYSGIVQNTFHKLPVVAELNCESGWLFFRKQFCHNWNFEVTSIISKLERVAEPNTSQHKSVKVHWIKSDVTDHITVSNLFQI